jgi:hypothetical protein
MQIIVETHAYRGKLYQWMDKEHVSVDDNPRNRAASRASHHAANRALPGLLWQW